MALIESIERQVLALDSRVAAARVSGTGNPDASASATSASAPAPLPRSTSPPPRTPSAGDAVGDAEASHLQPDPNAPVSESTRASASAAASFHPASPSTPLLSNTGHHIPLPDISLLARALATVAVPRALARDNLVQAVNSLTSEPSTITKPEAPPGEAQAIRQPSVSQVDGALSETNGCNNGNVKPKVCPSSCETSRRKHFDKDEKKTVATTENKASCLHSPNTSSAYFATASSSARSVARAAQELQRVEHTNLTPDIDVGDQPIIR